MLKITSQPIDRFEPKNLTPPPLTMGTKTIYLPKGPSK